MAIMTPRGLKVRLPAEFAFSFMGDLWERDPQTDAFRVLKTCEAISLLPSAVGYCTGMAVATGPTLAWAVVPAIVGGRLAGEIITRTPLLRVPGVVHLGLLWSCIHGYGVLLLMAALLTYQQNGVPGIVYWIAGGVVAEVVSTVIAYVDMRRLAHRLGVVAWDSEQRFILACALHARRLNFADGLRIEDAGENNRNWRFCLLNYAHKYPGVVARHVCMRQAVDQALGRNSPPKQPSYSDNHEGEEGTTAGEAVGD